MMSDMFFMKTNAYAYMGIGFILVSTLICIFL